MSMTTELINRLRQHENIEKSGFAVDGIVNDYREAADTIQLLSEKLHASQMERSSQYYNDGWIPVSERLPECEQEVLICTMKKVYVSRKTGMEWCEEPIITPALYEDGTMLEINSKWRWEDIDYAGWDEEEDCGIIPEGWWENRHFNPDDVYNNVVDKKVIAWMPLPLPWKAESEEV